MDKRTSTVPRSVFKAPTEEESLYFGMIDRAMEAREDKVISNGRPGHAVYLIHKMFTEAHGEVRILTGNLSRTAGNGEILAYSDPKIIDDAVSLVERGGRLSILVADGLDVDEGEPASSHPLFRALVDVDGYKDKVEVGSYEPKTKEGEPWPYHLAVMDRSALRVETDIDKNEAVVNFNDEKFATTASRMFDVWMDGAERLDWVGATADLNPA